MIQFIGIFIVLMIALYVRTIITEKRNREVEIKRLIEEFGSYKSPKYTQEQIDLIGHFHKSKGLNGKKSKIDAVDDITWHDLNMQEIYERMDSCGSFYGKEVLYDFLRCQDISDDELKRRDELISYFYDNEKDRSKLQYDFINIGSYVKVPLTDCFKDIKELQAGERSLTPHIDYASLLLGCVATVLIFVMPMIGFFVFFAVLFINLLTYYNRKKKIARYISCFGEILRLLYNTNNFSEYGSNTILNSYLKNIGDLGRALKPFCRGAFILISARRVTGNLLDIVLDYFRMFLHLDIIKFFSMLKIALAKEQEILELAYKVGELDACIAVASYRKKLEKEQGFFCKPVFFQNTDDGLNIRSLYHPLVKECVGNDIITRKSVLLTGSNASGKSTFLRSVALSCILAQSIYTCPAKEFSFKRVRVATSMSLSDDVLAGDSYYMKEIKSLKRIMDYSKQCSLLCVIDEVLKGTNTAERVSASAEILAYLSENAVCFAATHDLELATILSEIYDNYHFSEHIDTENNSIHFDYKMESGMTHSRNAIMLLLLMGFEERIVDRATERCIKLLKEKDFK